MGRPASDKRERLVSAAADVFHRAGYAGTSLADVAKSAGIPAGNVFYYFRSKDDLALAVVELWCSRLTSNLATISLDDDPWNRLESFIDQAGIISEMYVDVGCPLAGLASDLRQQGASNGAVAAKLYTIQSEWLTAQFENAGLASPVARRHARILMTGYHGATLLAYVQNDPTAITAEVVRLKSWLGEIKNAPMDN
jgi:TetR/AcrR family transcriptional regulator, transcriptional repressor for nem operon